CSECYEEFVVTPKDGVNAILCPECDHGAKAPSDEFLRKLGYHKQRESKKLIFAIVFFSLMLITSFVWILMLVNEPYDFELEGIYYVLPALMVIFMGVVIYFSVEYEGNRYEVYF
ncbi:MAG: hypothetical protein ABIH42_00625, partial [Planctomycetota bacterium]